MEKKIQNVINVKRMEIDWVQQNIREKEKNRIRGCSPLSVIVFVVPPENETSPVTENKFNDKNINNSI